MCNHSVKLSAGTAKPMKNSLLVVLEGRFAIQSEGLEKGLETIRYIYCALRAPELALACP